MCLAISGEGAAPCAAARAVSPGSSANASEEPREHERAYAFFWYVPW